MFNNKNYEYDCTTKCRLKDHGNAITAVLTKRSIQDDKLAAYVAKVCCNFIDNVDDLGRSAVHIAASVNRYRILEWLLNQGASANIRDYESGMTPLHRAIFYGFINCAVLLLRYSASLELLDEDQRNPLQYICRLYDVFSTGNNQYNNELLAWGLNKNYNLGVNNNQDIYDAPQILDYFRKERIALKSVALGSYHSIFLDKRFQVYMVGHGKGGRLGFGNEDSVTVPKKLTLKLKNQSEKVISVSVSRIHSLILTSHSMIYACGLNDYKQLGLKNQNEKLLNFKEVSTLRDLGVKGLIRIIACEYCSLTYSVDSIYVWGTNVGQMGFEIDKKVVPEPTMMKLPSKTKILKVKMNNAAIVVLTVDDKILIFYNYKMKILKAPNYESLKNIAVMETNISGTDKGVDSTLKLLILTRTNIVFLWDELTRQFYGCSFKPPLNRIQKILYKRNQVLIVSQGDVYRGKCQLLPMPLYYKDDVIKTSQNLSDFWNRYNNRSVDISKDFMIHVDLHIIERIDRVIDVYCDDDFSSFAALQESHIKYLKLPTLLMKSYKFKNLYKYCTLNDNVHDIIFHVDGVKHPAHKFIIYARSSVLTEIITNSENKGKKLDIYLDYPRLTSKMFEILMKFMYINYLPYEEVLLADLKDIQHSINTDERPKNILDVLKCVISYAEFFQLNDFAIYLKSYYDNKNLRIDKAELRFKPLHYTDYPELYDVCLICEGNIELFVHKCVLVERLEYFQKMFTYTWHEQSTVNFTMIPYEYMLCIVEFLYSMDVLEFRKKSYRESYLYNMIVYCDQFFIEKLREICEILLLEKIAIRNCGEMLDFACMFNCNRLKSGCLDYICQNIARVLLRNSLRTCDPLTLQEVNQHYRNMFKDIFDYRVITPDTNAIDDECLLNYTKDFHVDLEYKMNEKENDKKTLFKQKAKENKLIHCTPGSERQCEREAISSMIAKLNKTAKQELKKQQQKYSKPIGSDVSKDILDVDASNYSQHWLRVTMKKELKKKSLNVEKTLKINDILSKEGKCNDDFVSLRKVLVENNEKNVENITLSPTKITEESFHVNLADLTISPREKLSQKQRKRLLSYKNNEKHLELSPTEVKPFSEVRSTLLQSKPCTTKSYLTDYDKSISIIERGSLADFTSFAKIMHVSHYDNSCNKSTNLATSSLSPAFERVSEMKVSNDFSQILADEKRQRDNYERMLHKPLILTQIEEQAICELKDFYNVEHINDEMITIERKPQPQDNRLSFATWQRN